MSRPLLLDLYCGAGGAAMGYYRAGFDVVGVDLHRQPRYPFDFHQGDALAFLAGGTERFDAIHASPPCQAYTRKATHWGRPRVHFLDHPDLLGPTRDALRATGLLFVLENVPGSPIEAGILLCGTMFGLPIQKHRLFEVNWQLPALGPAGCNHEGTYNPWAGEGRSAARMREAQGTPWIPTSGGASRRAGVTGDLFNAIPPAYTEWIGQQLIAALEKAA